MERRTFEDSFKDVFRDAEATPSDKVWTNVELELEKENGTDIRRRLAFYQMLAAAAVTLALLATGVAYVMVSDRDNTIEQITSQSSTPPTSEPDQQGGDAAMASRTPSFSDNPSSGASRELARAGSDGSANDLARISNGTTQSDVSSQDDGKTIKRSGQHDSGLNNVPQVALNRTRDTDADVPGNGIDTRDAKDHGLSDSRNNPKDRSQDNLAQAESTDDVKRRIAGENLGGDITESSVASAAGVSESARVLPAFFVPVVAQPSMTPAAADPVAVMMARLAEEEMKLAGGDVQKDKNEKDAMSQEKVWTALGVAAGGFSAVNHGSSPMQASQGFALSNTQVPDKQSKASGVAYSLGLSFGTKVAPRWVVQGGLNYMSQSSNYVATNVITGPQYATLQAESINALGNLPELADAADASKRLAPTVPYSVNNNLKYFSVPMQAGYLVVNRKFGVQLNAGISTDLFLENTITPEGGSLDKTTQSSGSDSPYRTVNFSGLMGTEFSYRLGQRYRIALNPALRYPFSSVYKSDVGIQSMPLTFDVGLRFRYIFK